MARLFAVLLALLVAACAHAPPATAPAAASDPRTVILVSIDGFRADYFDRGLTPTLAAIAADGVRSRGLVPSFPTITFPNHYTLVTGLRPDRHGVVGNRMRDPAIEGDFRLSDRAQVMDRRWWDDAEPIWVTLERAGVPTATMFWPGSEAPVRGVRPSHWIPFQQSISSAARVDIVLGWLTMPAAERPRFVTLYFDVVDTAGHHHGPDSPELAAALADVDAALKRLREGLQARGLLDTTDLVVVGDHGMTDVAPERTIVIDELVDLSRVRLLESEALLGLTPQEGYAPALEQALLKPHPHMRCWRKGELPARFEFGRHPRIPPYLCLAERGWSLRTAAALERSRKSGDGWKGSHGFDPAEPDMHALFLASGPSFRKGLVLPPFDNVDVYPLLARLTGVRPRPHDGDLDQLAPALAR